MHVPNAPLPLLTHYEEMNDNREAEHVRMMQLANPKCLS